MMNHGYTTYDDLGVTVRETTRLSSNEHHLMLTASKSRTTFGEQLHALHEALGRYRTSCGLTGAACAFRRYFVSDASNQNEVLESELKRCEPCAISVVEQPPLDGAKVALWVYLIEGFEAEETADHNASILTHNGYKHMWKASAHCNTGTSAEQTSMLLCQYEAYLGAEGCTIADDCVRTWFFVRDVDTNYQGVVDARRENFEQVGLTAQTHYISSTGIEGRHADHHTTVLLDAYAIKGLTEGQMTYLYGSSHLNPTYEYGVTFERGTKIEYADRCHLFISGTASIDNHGNVLHIGDIEKQTRRMVENVEVLLSEGGARLSDVAVGIVYLRDIADSDAVRHELRQLGCDFPMVMVHAPVCRPQWLIEMECIAMVSNHNDKLRPF